MNGELAIRQVYRLYGIGILIWALLSGLWIGFNLNISATVVGSGWLIIAGVGTLLALGMAVMRASSEYSLFKTQSNQERIQRFNSHLLSSTPLHLYAIALAGWSFLTVEWWIINIGIVGRVVVAYGWFLIALYGLGLTVGLLIKHDDAVLEELDTITPDAIEPDS